MNTRANAFEVPTLFVQLALVGIFGLVWMLYLAAISFVSVFFTTQFCMKLAVRGLSPYWEYPTRIERFLSGVFYLFTVLCSIGGIVLFCSLSLNAVLRFVVRV